MAKKKTIQHYALIMTVSAVAGSLGGLATGLGAALGVHYYDAPPITTYYDDEGFERVESYPSLFVNDKGEIDQIDSCDDEESDEDIQSCQDARVQDQASIVYVTYRLSEIPALKHEAMKQAIQQGLVIGFVTLIATFFAIIITDVATRRRLPLAAAILLHLQLAQVNQFQGAQPGPSTIPRRSGTSII